MMTTEAVTQNGTARHTHHTGELRTEGFYHNFPRAQQAVDLQGAKGVVPRTSNTGNGMVWALNLGEASFSSITPRYSMR